MENKPAELDRIRKITETQDNAQAVCSIELHYEDHQKAKVNCLQMLQLAPHAVEIVPGFVAIQPLESAATSRGGLITLHKQVGQHKKQMIYHLHSEE